MRRIFAFGKSHVSMNYLTGVTITRFFDGSEVVAAPEDNDDYRKTALELGYGGDIAALSREHEYLHTYLSKELLGREYSYTLWDVAHGPVPMSSYHAHRIEEEIVLQFQKFMNEPRFGGLKGFEDWGRLAEHAYRQLRS